MLQARIFPKSGNAHPVTPADGTPTPYEWERPPVDPG